MQVFSQETSPVFELRHPNPFPKVTVLQQYVTPQVAASVIYIIDF